MPLLGNEVKMEKGEKDTMQPNGTKDILKLCRICSNPGYYDIFSVIPMYLHAGQKEFAQWQKDISIMIEETTGLTVDPRDGLPQKICAICISYLKHASTFRQQAIDNILSIKAAQKVLSGPESKCPIIQSNENDKVTKDTDVVSVTADDLIFSETRKTDTISLANIILNNHTKANDYVKEFLFNGQSAGKKSSKKPNVTTCLNMLFDVPGGVKMPPKSARKRFRRWNSTEAINYALENMEKGEEFQTTSSDDAEISKQKTDIFSYKEKYFQEDDITQLDVFKEANIVVKLPEYFEERKCPACLRRFMYEDSFQEHTQYCVEYKLFVFIGEITRLLNVRQNKGISPHEFVRRMIFFLRRMCEWLNSNCGETIKLPEVDDSAGSGNLRKVLNEKVKTDCDDGNIKLLQMLNSGGTHRSTSSLSTSTSEKNHNPLLELLRSKAEPNLIHLESRSPDPLLDLLRQQDPHSLRKPKFDSISSDSSFACSTIEQTMRQNIELPTPPRIENGRKSLLECFNQAAHSSPVLARPIPLVSPARSPFSPVLSRQIVSACCRVCATSFDSITSLEDHNARFHNDTEKLEEHKRIIAMFECEESTANKQGSVNAVNGGSPKPNKASTKKMIRCKLCEENFQSIIHLDQHRTKFHCNTRGVVA